MIITINRKTYSFQLLNVMAVVVVVVVVVKMMVRVWKNNKAEQSKAKEV